MRKFNEDANQKKIAELRDKLKKYYKLYEEAKVRNLWLFTTITSRLN